MASEAISEHLIFKNFPGEHATRPPSLACLCILQMKASSSEWSKDKSQISASKLSRIEMSSTECKIQVRIQAQTVLINANFWPRVQHLHQLLPVSFRSVPGFSASPLLFYTDFPLSVLSSTCSS